MPTSPQDPYNTPGFTVQQAYTPGAGTFFQPDGSVDLADLSPNALSGLNGTYGQFRQQTFRAGRRWLFLGDSITNGSAATTGNSFVQQVVHMAGSMNVAPDSIEGGTSGYSTSRALAYLPTLLALSFDGGVVVLLGTNDSGDTLSVPLATYQANMAAIVTAAKATGRPVVIATPPPRSTASATTTQRARLDAYVLWLRLWAGSVGAELADVHTALADTTTGNMLAAYDSGDGIHPNDAGHQKIAQVVAAAMLRAYATTRPSAVLYAGVNQLVNNPLMLSAGTDPTTSFAVTGTGTAPTRSMVADTSGQLAAGQWAQVALSAAADSVFSRALTVQATGWAVGDTLAACCVVQVTDTSGDWMTKVAAGTAEVRVTIRNSNTSVTIANLYDRTPGLPLGAGVYQIGPIFMPFTVPVGVTAMDMPYKLTVPNGSNYTAKFGGFGVFNLTALGLTPGSATIQHYDGP